MVDSKSKKSIAPEGEELSNAISLFLKDHDGPVDVTVVAKKLKDAHPTWKLPERRVSKFVKRYMNAENDPTEADKDDDDAEEKAAPKSPMKKLYSSPTRSLKRLFSAKSKKKNPFFPEDADTASETPEPEPSPAEEAPLPEKGEGEPVDDKPEEDVVEESKPTEEEKIDKDLLYEIDNDHVDSSNDCFTGCSIM